MVTNNSPSQELTDNQIYLRALTHEMKTPLAVMQGILETMLGDVLNPALTGQHIGRVAQELARLKAIVDDVSLRVRVETGPLALRPAPLNILEIVDYALADARAAFGGREFVAEAPDRLPQMMVDQPMLHMLLLTLLYNGALHRLSGQPVLLRIAVAADGVEFSVEDELAPFPGDVADRLFEPRPDFPRTLHLPQFGLGLRLYAARKIARQMGGELSLVPGWGNRYQLRLPLRLPAAVPVGG